MWIMKTIVQFVFSWVKLTCDCDDLSFKCTRNKWLQYEPCQLVHNDIGWLWHWNFMIYFIDHRLWFKIHNIWMENLPQRILTESYFFTQFQFFTLQFIYSKFTVPTCWNYTSGILSRLILCRLSDEFIPAPILSLAYFRNETCISDISFSLAALRPLSASICFSWFHNYEITSRWYFIELILNQPEHISCALNWNSFRLFLTTFDNQFCGPFNIVYTIKTIYYWKWYNGSQHVKFLNRFPYLLSLLRCFIHQAILFNFTCFT